MYLKQITHDNHDFNSWTKDKMTISKEDACVYKTGFSQTE